MELLPVFCANFVQALHRLDFSSALLLGGVRTSVCAFL